MEWEVAVAHWARDDRALLQPATPSWIVMAIFCSTMMKAKITKKELELCATPPAYVLCLVPTILWSYS